MKLNKGWREGTIGAPHKDGTTTIVHYYVKAAETESELGIEGGKITGLVLNAEKQTLGYYAGEDGWVIEPDENNEAAMIALAICLKEYN